MLSLRPPIRLQTDHLFTRMGEAFSQRITANYQVMGAKLTPEAFLHIAATPPEIYMAEGNVINLVEQNNLVENRGNWISIFNNLLNRVLISNDTPLTYQDNVYITGLLSQLGVKDSHTFMSEVHKLMKESKNMHELLTLYRSHSDELREMVSRFQSEVQTEREARGEQEKAQVLHLHNEIYNRLQTGEIYNVMKASMTQYGAPTAISKEEYYISEQTRLAENLELQQYQNYVRSEVRPLIYRHENIYEGDQILKVDLNEENVTNRVSSAVLLNLIDNLYQRHLERAGDLSNRWLINQSAFYGSADKTFRRIENHTDYIQYLQEQGDVNQEISNSYRKEISLVQQLLQEGSRYISSGNAETFISGTTHITEGPEYRTEINAAPMAHLQIENNIANEYAEERTIQENQAHQILQNRTENRNLQNLLNIRNELRNETRNLRADMQKYEVNLQNVEAQELTHIDQRSQSIENLTEEVKNLTERQDVRISREGDTFNQAGQEFRQLVQHFATKHRAGDSSETVNEQQTNITQSGNYYFPQNVNNESAEMIFREGDHVTEGDQNQVNNLSQEQNVRISREGDALSQASMEFRQLVQRFASEHREGDSSQTLTEQVNISQSGNYYFPESVNNESVEMVFREGDRFTEGDQEQVNNYSAEQNISSSYTVNQEVRNSEEFRTLTGRYQTTNYGGSETETNQFFAGGSFTENNAFGGDQFVYADGNTVNEAGDQFISQQNIEQNPEILRQELERINQRNIERSERFQETMRQLELEYRAVPEKGGRERTIRESIDAISHPEIYIQQFKEAAAANEARQQEFREKAARLMGEKEGMANELLQSYLENPEKFEAMNLVTHNDMGQLARDAFFFDSEHTERQVTRRELEERMQEVATSASEWATEHTVDRNRVRRQRENIRELELTHRQVNHTLDEEMLEQFFEQREGVRETTRTVQNNVVNNDVVDRRVINNTRTTETEQNDQDIMKIVNNSIRRQVDSISEKVYNRLERRLENEKRRRGL